MFWFRKLFFSIFFVLIFFQSKAQQSHVFSVYFGVNQYIVKSVDREFIKLKIDSLSKFSISKIEIVGHTDNSADSIYNVNLSNQRAKEVKNVLIGYGFNQNIIDVVYFGENRPVVDNDNEIDKGLNRRAEVIVFYSEGGIAAKPCQQGDTIIKTKSGKQIIFDRCEFFEIENCLEILEHNSQSDYRKGIVVLGSAALNLPCYGRLQIELLDGCVGNECFKNPVRVRFPINKPAPDESVLPWALVKGERNPLKLVKIKDKYFYELILKCPTSWINCNCKKNQKH